MSSALLSDGLRYFLLAIYGFVVNRATIIMDTYIFMSPNLVIQLSLELILLLKT